jgi:hypothetical protein
VFVFGVVSRRTVSVRVLTRAGDVFEAKLYEPAVGSRVRGGYFVAALPEGTETSQVESIDAAGHSRRRDLSDVGGPLCAS